MMTLQITCPECQSSIDVYADKNSDKAKCEVCSHEVNLQFNKEHTNGELRSCPLCSRKDFFKQKDFNRKIGVILFVIAAITSLWTYGVSFIILYACDFFLFKKLRFAAICYKCSTIFRNISNMNEVHDFNHEMHDRIVYADHDFEGEQLEH